SATRRTTRPTPAGSATWSSWSSRARTPRPSAGAWRAPSPRRGRASSDPDVVRPGRRRQQRRQEGVLHQGAGRLAPPLRLGGGHHRGVGARGDPGRQGEEGRDRPRRRGPHPEGDRAAGRQLHPLRRQLGRPHQQGRRADRHPHLRAGRARAARQALHEDRVAGAGGAVMAQGAKTIARGDTVVVTKGREKGKRGKVKRVLKNGRVEIEKVMMIKRHTKPTQKNPQGGIMDLEGSVAVANVALWCETCSGPRRVRAGADSSGKKVRVCVDCGTAFPRPGM